MKTRILITALWAAATFCACRNGETASDSALSAAEANTPAVSTASPVADFPAPPAQWAQVAPLAHTPLNAAKLPPQQFEIAADEEATFTTRAGFQFDIPADAFLDAAGRPFTGQATVTVREAVTVHDFIRAGLMTMAGDTPLRSGGMFQFTANDAATGAALSLAPGKRINGQTPVLDREYKLFRGRQTADGELDWTAPVSMDAEDRNGPRAVGNGANLSTLDGFLDASTVVRIDAEMIDRLNALGEDIDSLQTVGLVDLIKLQPARMTQLSALLKRFTEEVKWAQEHPTPSLHHLQPLGWGMRSPRGAPYIIYQVDGRIYAERKVLYHLGMMAGYAKLVRNGLVSIPNAADAQIRQKWLDITRLTEHLLRLQRLEATFDYGNIYSNYRSIRADGIAITRYWNSLVTARQGWHPHPTTRETIRQRAECYTSYPARLDASPRILSVDGQHYAALGDLSQLWMKYDTRFMPICPLIPGSETYKSGYNSYRILNLFRRDSTRAMWLRFYGVAKTYASYIDARPVLDSLNRIINTPHEARTLAVENQLATRYGFTLSELGWYNCDIYMREPWQPQEVIVQLEDNHTPENTQLYVVYPTERMVFQFPIGPDGTAHVRLFDRYAGQLLLVSGERASGTAARRQNQPITVTWQGAGALSGAIVSR